MTRAAPFGRAMTAAAGVLLALTLVSAVIDWLAVRHGHQAMALPVQAAHAGAADGDRAGARPRRPHRADLVRRRAGDVAGRRRVPDAARRPVRAGARVVPAGRTSPTWSGWSCRASNPPASSSASRWSRSPSRSSGRASSRGRVAAEPALGPPVLAYMVRHLGDARQRRSARGAPLAIAGALLFYASDALIGWGRFVEAREWRRPRRDGDLPPRPGAAGALPRLTGSVTTPRPAARRRSPRGRTPRPAGRTSRTRSPRRGAAGRTRGG